MKAILGIDPIQFPLTGIGRYTCELARGLKQAELESLWLLRAGQLVPGDSPLRPSSVTPQQVRLSRLRGLVGRSRLLRRLRHFTRQTQETKTLAGLPDHVFHGPNYTLPEFHGPSVVTVHDLSIFQRPGDHPGSRVASMSKDIEQAVKLASAIITDSHTMRQEILHHFVLPEESVFAVHLAGGSEFYPRPASQLEASLAPFGLTPQGYTLFTGTIEPRKNLTSLLAAYEALAPSIRNRWPLVVAGYQGWLSQDVHAQMKRAAGQGWLRYLGFVSQDLLPSFMAGARLFAFPSHYEGFGLPVVEAMASGVPVVCSNATCLPEVGGQAAAYHEPEDSEALTGLLGRGLCDEEWRARARSQGLARASDFSWQRCVEETLAVYKFAAKAHASRYRLVPRLKASRLQSPASLPVLGFCKSWLSASLGFLQVLAMEIWASKRGWSVWRPRAG